MHGFVRVRVAIAKRQLPVGLVRPQLHHLLADLLVCIFEKRPGERAIGCLGEAGFLRRTRRDAGRVRRHPHHVRQQVVADRREVVAPQQVARGLRHRGDLAAREQIFFERRSLERLGREVRGDVTVHDERRAGIAGLAERQLHVRERLGEVGVDPAVLDLLRGLRRERVDLGGGVVVDRAVVLELEELERHRLEAQRGHAGDVERQLAGDAAALELAHVVGRRVVEREQALDRVAIGRQRDREVLLVEGREARRIAGVLERDRRDLARVGERDERTAEVAAAERIHDRRRHGRGPQRREERARRRDVRVGEVRVALRHLGAVLVDERLIDAGRQRIAPAARDHAIEQLRVGNEVTCIAGRSGPLGVRRHRRH